MAEYLVLRVVPRPLTAVMMARLMPAAIKAYSMAVAPDWSAKNRNIMRFKTASFESRGLRAYPAFRVRNLSAEGINKPEVLLPQRQ